MWSGTPKLAFVALIVLNCILWSQSRYANVGGTRSALAPGFAKRGFSDGDQLSPFRLTANEVSCAFLSPTAVCWQEAMVSLRSAADAGTRRRERASGGFEPGAVW